uniref:Uncharacterized protein n=1 Tax=Timema shepardi TaxID=629360 RepID=A0A7R9BA97_TIMSH|nr:unnamed protein product [Timema shepardi]
MDEWTLNDLLECSVCLERLDTSSKVLPCQHTFCKKCLEEIVSTHKELRCPECRVLIDIKIEELPPNVLLMRILEGMRNAAPKKCGIGTPSRAQGGHFPQAAVQQMSPAVQHPVAPNTAMVQSLEITTRTPVTPKQTMTQPNQPYARAVYDYLSNEPGDLTFKKGDIIFLRKKIDTNWCQGECGGNQGVFPLTYVQVITPLPSHIPQCKALYDFRMTIDDEEGCLTFNKGEVITVIRRVDENWAEGKLSQPGPSRVAPPTPTSEDTTPLIPTDHSRTVTNSQSSQHHHHHHHHHHNTPVVSTQITHQGSTTTEHSHQHIILGTSDSSSTVSSASSSTTTPNTSSSNTSSSSSTAPSSPTSPAHAAQTPARPNHPVSPPHREKRHSFSVLPHTAHNNQTSHRHSAEILSPTNIDRLSGGPRGGVVAAAGYIALYPYKPQKVDELELKKGCIYMVTERCQDGWFKGTSSRSQKSGVFPGNYVTPAKESYTVYEPRYPGLDDSPPIQVLMSRRPDLRSPNN